MENNELSFREIEVMRLMAKGMGRDRTADALHISKHTVGNHLKKIYKKLDARNGLEAVYKCFQLGYIKLEKDNDNDNDE